MLKVMWSWFNRKMRYFRRSISAQLTRLMFGITALVIVVMSFLAIRALSDAGQSTEKIASTAMEKRVQQTMMQTVESTAAINSLIFGTVVRQVENAAS